MGTSISFISNTDETHKAFLLNHFAAAEEIIFAVGFLKNSGLQNFKEYLKEFCTGTKSSSTFFIGTGFGETDPETLHSLYNIIKSGSRHELILCTPDAGIFHPKIYVFRTGKRATIVTGSSNLTQHGWVVNDEISVVFETDVSSSEYLQLKRYLKQLHKKYYSDDVESLIQRYKKERDAYLMGFSKPPPFRFKRRRSSIAGIDMPRLKMYYEAYKYDKSWFIEPELREDQYKKALNKLEQLSGKKSLTLTQFHKLFGPLVGHKDYKPKLWHSGSIHRATYETLNYPEAFREIVRTVKLNVSNPVSIAYENVLKKLNHMRKAKLISGVGENIVTEIFLSFNSEKFANLNVNPLAVLKLVGKEFSNVSGFKGEDYAEYVELLSKIKKELGMRTFLEIDSFFNYVYWNLIDE